MHRISLEGIDPPFQARTTNPFIGIVLARLVLIRPLREQSPSIGIVLARLVAL